MLVFEFEVEVPQNPVNEILRREVIAITFRDDDAEFPEVEALRAEFPIVPHLNLRSDELPRSLCLYESTWPDEKLSWSPRGYLERIRTWLAQTARGELHQPDQALEPFFLGTGTTFILGDSVLEDLRETTPAGVWICRCDAGLGRVVLIPTGYETGGNTSPVAPFAAMTIESSSQTAGAIRRTPKSLEDLHRLFSNSGFDLVATVRKRLAGWREKPDLLDKQLVLVIVVPLTRVEDGVTETSEVWAFLCDRTVAEVGEAVDLWQRQETGLGYVIRPDATRLGNSISLLTCNVVRDVSSDDLRRFNGYAVARTPNVVAIGAGALGSQILMTLARGGWVNWTIVDHDYLLPHNLARHTLSRGAIGFPKAESLALVINDLVPQEAGAKPIVANILRPDQSTDQMAASVREADLIIDTSASVPVARHISKDMGGAARRVSLFLNPSGTDLVVLAEDSARAMRLDILEMQYYRLLLDDPSLKSHLVRNAGPFRYGGGCREVSLQLSQESVALFASIGASFTRRLLDRKEASITVFRSVSEDLTVARVDLAPVSPVEQQFDAWRLVTDHELLARVVEARQDRLPRETGGVLVGAIDTERRLIYAVTMLASPSDSQEWPTSYIRGSHGLLDELEQVRIATAGQLDYIGEWHSHPDGHSASMSTDDRKAFDYFADVRRGDGWPAVFLIVSDREHRWFVSSDQIG